MSGPPVVDVTPLEAHRRRCVTELRCRGWHDAAGDFAAWIDLGGTLDDPAGLEDLLDARRRDDPLRAADLLDGLSTSVPIEPVRRDARGRQRASALDPAAEARLQQERLGPMAATRVVLGASGCPLVSVWIEDPTVEVWAWDPVDPEALPVGARNLSEGDLPPANATIWIHPALAGADREAALVWRARIRGQEDVAPTATAGPLRALVLIGPRPFHVEAPLVEALRRLGVATAVARVQGDFRDDAVADAIVQARPDRVICINGAALVRAPVVRAALAVHEIPTVLWFVDEPDAALGNAREALAASHVLALAWEREAVARLRRNGFQGAAFLPHGTRWTEPADPLPGVGDLLWVGTSYAGSDRAARHAGAAGPLSAAWREAAHRLRDEPGLSLAGLRELIGDPEDSATARVLQVRIGDDVAAARRGAVAKVLMPLGLQIFGDRDGWSRLLGSGARFGGDVDAATVFPHLVGGSRLSVDCVHPQMPTAVTQRVFDVPACGGLVLADDRPDLREHFDPGTEVLTYASLEEAVDRARWALDHPGARDRIARAARRRVLAEHTLLHRARRLLRFAEAHFGRAAG